MTRAEVKDKIFKMIDTLPDKSLEAIYEVFQNAENKKSSFIESNLKKIINDDADVLRRLAK